MNYFVESGCPSKLCCLFFAAIKGNSMMIYYLLFKIFPLLDACSCSELELLHIMGGAKGHGGFGCLEFAMENCRKGYWWRASLAVSCILIIVFFHHCIGWNLGTLAYF